MRLISPVFDPNQAIPAKYTCDGENISPPLTFQDIPENAQSLVLIVDDPDAVSKKPWIHWVVYNINPKSQGFEENSLPDDVKEGMTDFGKTGWGGPCPPSGNHRYFFKFYALDTKLEFKDSPTLEDLKDAMGNHIIDEAQLIGLYQRG